MRAGGREAAAPGPVRTGLILPGAIDRGVSPVPLHHASHSPPPRSGEELEWIVTRPGLPYFVTESGRAWHPVGDNNAVEWPELNGLFRRRDPAAVETFLRMLADHGVTVIRLMLEYVHKNHRYLEKPQGCFAPAMVRYWDDLFALCETTGIRLLLTPLDTFWMYLRWAKHPWNARNGGTVPSRRELLTHPAARAAIKARLAFATTRWGGSGALFGWDLYNETHPAHGLDDPACVAPYIADVGPWLRDLETRLHGRAHPQTTSIFGPQLITQPELNEPIFRHPALDFANTHMYEHGTIDDPRDTVAPALAAARLIRAAIAETRDQRPVFDSEHGPIHRFKDKRRSLPEAFDDEYFLHMQWAHLAAGGAGGGMRWPNRSPRHVLTPGMRAGQAALSRFLPVVDWARFDRRPVDVVCSDAGVAAIGCADGYQAVVFLLRTDSVGEDRRVMPKADPLPARISISEPISAREALLVDPARGETVGVVEVTSEPGTSFVDVPSIRDRLVLAWR